jgi:hypothetical protein
MLKHYRVALKDQPWTLPEADLAAFEPAGLEASLALSSRPPLNLAEQIRALQAYPYGCLEQTTSGLYPSLYADADSLKRLGIKGEPAQVRKRKIEMGIEHLLGMQRYNGSFGLWSSDSEEEYWLTAYVTDFLLRARDQGYGVPAEAEEGQRAPAALPAGTQPDRSRLQRKCRPHSLCRAGLRGAGAVAQPGAAGCPAQACSSAAPMPAPACRWCNWRWRWTRWATNRVPSKPCRRAWASAVARLDGRLWQRPA